MIVRFFHDLKKYLPYSVKAAKATLSAEVAGSYLNWIWWILNPLCFMIIYAFVFGTVFRMREQFFSVYIYIGLTMWNFFSTVLKGSVRQVKRNKALLSKVYMPKYVLIINSILVNGFKLLISLLVIFFMLIIYRIRPSWSMFYLIPILIGLVLVTFSISCFTLHCGVYIQDLTNIIALILRIFFYMTGIFFDIEKRVPAPANFWVLRLNPLACLLTQARGALLNGEILMWKWLLTWISVGLILSLLGVRLIYRKENNYVKVV